MPLTTPLYNVSFTRSFSVADDETVATDLQLVASRLFTDRPSDAVIEDDTDESATYGFIERITSWSAGSATGEKLLTYSAITDPDPHDIGHDTLYEVINYQLASGAPESYEVRPFTIKRPSSLQARLYVSATDITALEYKIADIRSPVQLTAAIAECEEMFIHRLRRNQWERHRVLEGDYNRAFRLFCMARICQTLSDEPGDIWWKKAFGETATANAQATYGGYWGEYHEAYSNDPIHEDIDQDKNFTDAEIQTKNVFYFQR